MSQQAIKEIFAEDHISYSAIGKYLRCPRSYRFKYLDRAPPETRASALIFGSAIHEALAHFYIELKNEKPEPSHAEVSRVFRDYFRIQMEKPLPVLFGEKESEGGLVDTGVEMLRVFLEKADRPYKVIDVESPFSVELIDWETGEVLPRLVGIFDAVIQHANLKFEILEHKTAAKRWPQNRIENDGQISLYTHVAPLVGFENADVTIQVLLKLKKAAFEVYRTTRTDRQRHEFLETAVGVLRAVDAGAFYACRDWHCRTCEFSQRCNS
jgi:putative RecB family exonuclease